MKLDITSPPTERGLIQKIVAELMVGADHVEAHHGNTETVKAMRGAATKIAAVDLPGTERVIPTEWVDENGDFKPGFEYLGEDPKRDLN